MKSYKENIVLRVVAGVLLAVFLFTFFHSELELLRFGCTDHDAHDYCTIVNSGYQKLNKNLSANVFRLKAENLVCFHCVNEATPVINTPRAFENTQHSLPHYSSELYLFNRVFLI